jgi:hypothetical protein
MLAYLTENISTYMLAEDLGQFALDPVNVRF